MRTITSTLETAQRAKARIPYCYVEYYDGSAWVDITSDVLECRKVEEVYGGHVDVILDNSSETYNTFSEEGKELRVHWGLVTSEGNEKSQAPSTWIDTWSWRSYPGKSVLILKAIGCWEKLSRWRVGIQKSIAISSVSGTFQAYETITGGTSGAEGYTFAAGASSLEFHYIGSTSFSSGETITGGTSGATATAGAEADIRTGEGVTFNTSSTTETVKDIINGVCIMAGVTLGTSISEDTLIDTVRPFWFNIPENEDGRTALIRLLRMTACEIIQQTDELKIFHPQSGDSSVETYDSTHALFRETRQRGAYLPNKITVYGVHRRLNITNVVWRDYHRRHKRGYSHDYRG
jgi:hypothetical protein